MMSLSSTASRKSSASFESSHPLAAVAAVPNSSILDPNAIGMDMRLVATGPPDPVTGLYTVTMASVIRACEEHHLPVFFATLTPAPELPHNICGFEFKITYLSQARLKLHSLADAEHTMRVFNSMTNTLPVLRQLWQATVKSNTLMLRPEPLFFQVAHYKDTPPVGIVYAFNYPCYLDDGSGERVRAYVSYAQPRNVAAVGDVTHASLLQEHMQLKYTPVMVAYLNAAGNVLSQNSYSFGAIGCHGRDQHLPGWTDETDETLYRYLDHLFEDDEASREEMKQAHQGGQLFHKIMPIRSKRMRRWLGLGDEDARWHEVSISNFKDPNTYESAFVVAEVDVTEIVESRQAVSRLQADTAVRQALLREILPQQVIDRLLERGKVRAMRQALAARRRSSLEQPQQAGSTTSRSEVTMSDSGAELASASGSGLEQGSGGSSRGQLSRSHSGACDWDQKPELDNADVSGLATFHEAVTILFMDIKGFTIASQQVHPQDVMIFLNDLYARFDAEAEHCGVYKVETIGDCYMAACGLFSIDKEGNERLGGFRPGHAETMLRFACAALDIARSVKTPLGQPVDMRVGIHTGSCMSGVVGYKMPRFCLFGDTVNTASRMESTAPTNCIHVSAAVRDILPDEPWQPTGGVDVKGKGWMETYLFAPNGALPVELPDRNHATYTATLRQQRGPKLGPFVRRTLVTVASVAGLCTALLGRASKW